MINLQEIISNKKIELEARKQLLSFDCLKEQVSSLNLLEKKSFKDSITKQDKIKFITEIKKKSPSKGIINEDVNILDTAKIYEQSDAGAISVLTDLKYFGGKLDYLKQVSLNVNLPCLCKDFIVDEYQIYEAKLYKASAFLIIAKVLTKEEIKSFLDTAEKLNLDALVEVHDLEDIEKIKDLNIKIIGINNRCLNDFSVDINRSKDLFGYLDNNAVKISESGIYTREDVLFLENLGFDAVLVGTSLMQSSDIAGKLKELQG